MAGTDPRGLILMCGPYAGGALFYSQLGGIWGADEEWPAPVLDDPRRIVICTNDAPPLTLPPSISDRAGAVAILDFLILNGARDTTHAHTGATTPRKAAADALGRNYALVRRYQDAGPYESILVVPAPPGLAQSIDAGVAARMEGYLPAPDQEALRERLRFLPDHCVDLAIYKSYTWEPAKVGLLGIAAEAGRKVYRDLALPLHEADAVGDEDLDRAVRLRGVGRVGAALGDGVSRWALEEELWQMDPALCATAGSAAALLDLVLARL